MNLHRAELCVIQEVLGKQVTRMQLDLLEDFRHSGKPFSAGQALLAMQMTTSRINEILPLLTDVSSCYSMRLTVEDSPRQWRRMYVRQEAGSGRPRQIWSFEW